MIDLDRLNIQDEARFKKKIKTLKHHLLCRRNIGALWIGCALEETAQMIREIERYDRSEKVEIIELHPFKQNWRDIVERSFFKQNTSTIAIVKRNDLAKSFKDSWNARLFSSIFERIDKSQEQYSESNLFILSDLETLEHLSSQRENLTLLEEGIFEQTSRLQNLENNNSIKNALLEGNIQDYIALSSFERQQRVNEIKSILSERDRVFSTQSDLGLELGNIFYFENQYQDAIASYDRVLETLSNSYKAWNNRGVALEHLEQYEEAIISYDRALKIKPDFDKAWYNKGIALKELERYEAAIESYNQALQYKTNEHDTWNNRGVALEKIGCYEEAIASYNQALRFKPDKAETWYNKGVALAQLGYLQEALNAYEKALEQQNNLHDAWNNRGVILRNLGRYEEALNSYDRAVQCKPNKYEAWNNRGVLLGMLGRYQEEQLAYDRALRCQPNNSEAWINQGVALASLGDIEVAILAYNQALQLQPNNPTAWYNKACCHALQTQFDLALESLQSAIELDPKTIQDWAKTEPDLDAIQHDPRFQKLLRQ
ncbi:tetratricopeptide repeat protein [Lusitaniella coriacea LEGE 07157]|uniref:Tetratricopeptide repeat protein n=1 Tax=Lusitaniella coriacea LEGE 07157 TaxID=945747 RepID=A0A8J7IV83_9CYAN|nr:tetratricopeptide repeat protein [Lusitaniella coriacea]MBE9117058.1 tetratricopeptide repeat protein [Lusitaniella coriacea LEGE 07157]